MNLKDALELIGGLTALCAIIWQIARVKSAIDDAIDAVKDESFSRHKDLEKRLEVHLQDYSRRIEIINNAAVMTGARNEEKFRQIQASLRSIEKHIEGKQNFRMREYLSDESIGYPDDAK